MTIPFSEDQLEAITGLVKFAANSRNIGKIKFLSGPPGSGKSEIIREVTRQLTREGKHIHLAAYTGRTAAALSDAAHETGTSTLHHLLYHPVQKFDSDEIIFVLKEPEFPYDVLIIDECVMLPQRIFTDVRFGYPNAVILLVGDFHQLRGTAASFLPDPDYTLTEIFRGFAGTTLDLVLREVRSRTYLGLKYLDAITDDSYIEFQKDGYDMDWLMEHLADYDIVLTQTNSVRMMLNGIRRESLGHIGELAVGEPVLVLSNNYPRQLMNGQRYEVTCIHERLSSTRFSVNLKLMDKKEPQPELEDLVVVLEENTPDARKLCGFGNYILCDYGYALSVHKAQGSEFPNILFVDTWIRAQQELYWPMLYTALSRAKQRMTRYIVT